MSTLILLRHGESVWNAEDRFAGWVDVPLNDAGRAEAARSGDLLAAAGILPDVLHTSVLRRSITTAALALDACDRHWISRKPDVAAQRKALRGTARPSEKGHLADLRSPTTRRLAPGEGRLSE